MRRSVMKLTLKALTGWLTEHFPPSGKPFVYDLEAEGMGAINAIVDRSGPEFTDSSILTEDSIRQIYEWIFTALVSGSSASERGWGLAIHSLRLYTMEHLRELLERIKTPPTTIGHRHDIREDDKEASETEKEGVQ